jgi:hypothetical protein
MLGCNGLAEFIFRRLAIFFAIDQGTAMAAGRKKAAGLTRKQGKLLAEVEELAAGLNLDHWNVDQKRKPDDRIVFLEVVRDKMIRAEVVTKYALIDEYLTNIICNYYFGRPRGDVYRALWRRKDFTIFVHYLMDEIYLLKKLSIVRAIRPVPKDVVTAVSRINDVRNDLAHSLFPQNRRRYVVTGKKVFYDGVQLFSKEGVIKFLDDFHLAGRYFGKRASGNRADRYPRR